MAAAGPDFLVHSAIYMGSAVVAVPIFKRLGLGSVLGYLAAGSVIGPFGLGLIADAESTLHFAEFGVVLLLFIIGLELKPSRLWSMRRAIFGLGMSQVVITGFALTGLALLIGTNMNVAVVAGFGLALSSTAFALQILEEKGALNLPYGNTAFSILLFQDLAIVPLLTLVAFLAPSQGTEETSGLLSAAIMISTIVGFILAGKFLLNPILRIIALARAREIFIAAALLLVIGASLIMVAVGLSMALGAFLAGVLLADSEYRHELEANVEPFRGLLLGLFFIAVGMSVNWQTVLSNAGFVAMAVVVLMAIKGAIIYLLSRLFGSEDRDAQRVAVTIPQGGEFAFVLFSVATANSVMPSETANLLTAVVGISMALTPLIGLVHERILRSRGVVSHVDLEGPDQSSGNDVIIVGFGRVGQIVSQLMHARGYSVTTVDNDPERIETSKKYGNKVFFGDVRRIDVLTAAGAAEARLLFVCVDETDATNEAMRTLRTHFPNLEVLVRAHDRNHLLELQELEADYLIRDTFESSVELGKEGLRRLGVEPALVEEIEAEFRRRDQERLAVQKVEGEFAGVERVFTSYDTNAKADTDN
jgi:CPA2 family monovalent cation:H+ antiporter-2/glutathione-regulated potassium-efflux system protein KefB